MLPELHSDSTVVAREMKVTNQWDQ